MGIKINDMQHNTHLLGSSTSDENLDKGFFWEKMGQNCHILNLFLKLP
jgi:hypothetical protein